MAGPHHSRVVIFVCGCLSSFMGMGGSLRLSPVIFVQGTLSSLVTALCLFVGNSMVWWWRAVGGWW